MAIKNYCVLIFRELVFRSINRPIQTIVDTHSRKYSMVPCDHVHGRNAGENLRAHTNTHTRARISRDDRNYRGVFRYNVYTWDQVHGLVQHDLRKTHGERQRRFIDFTSLHEKRPSWHGSVHSVTHLSPMTVLIPGSNRGKKKNGERMG